MYIETKVEKKCFISVYAPNLTADYNDIMKLQIQLLNKHYDDFANETKATLQYVETNEFTIILGNSMQTLIKTKSRGKLVLVGIVILMLMQMYICACYSGVAITIYGLLQTCLFLESRIQFQK